MAKNISNKKTNYANNRPNCLKVTKKAQKVNLQKVKVKDENGNVVVAEKPNAYKFESFIFDAFDMLDDMAILRVKREEEFAPVKNAEGTDSPETARALYEKFYNL